MTLNMNGKIVTVEKAQKAFGVKVFDWMLREAYKIKAVNIRNPITETNWTDRTGTHDLTISL